MLCFGNIFDCALDMLVQSCDCSFGLLSFGYVSPKWICAKCEACNMYYLVSWHDLSKCSMYYLEYWSDLSKCIYWEFMWPALWDFTCWDDVISWPVTVNATTLMCMFACDYMNLNVNLGGCLLIWEDSHNTINLGGCLSIWEDSRCLDRTRSQYDLYDWHALKLCIFDICLLLKSFDKWISASMYFQTWVTHWAF